MNIPPILEQLLLSNEAVFKNASLGLSGQNMVFVPQGKTAVLLEVSIEPFINQIAASFKNFLTDGYVDGTGQTIYRLAIRRMHYMLQIISDNYSTYINLADKLSISGSNTRTVETDRFSMFANLEFTGKREELFIYTDRSMYFNLIYPFKLGEEGPNTTGIANFYTTPVNGFLPKIQVLPKTPTTFYDNTTEDYVVRSQINSGGADQFYPVGHQTNPAFSAELNQMEYLRYFNVYNENTVQQPLASGTELQWHDMFNVPFINVKYALLNKRPEDYGIVRPGK
jgi:hypothetical protein